jgi:hypothetical protein
MVGGTAAVKGSAARGKTLFRFLAALLTAALLKIARGKGP